MTPRRLAIALVATLAMGTSGVAQAAWTEPVSGPLNIDPTKGALRPDVAGVGGVPYVVWTENSARVEGGRR